MPDAEPTRVSRAKLEAEAATLLPDKEVISLLNLNVDLDLALDLAAPIDLAVAANANVAAPIDAAVSANVLSLDSAATAAGTQAVLIDQFISGDAIADAPQDAVVDQSDDVIGTGDATTAGDTTGETAGTGDVTNVADPTTIDDTIGDVTDVTDTTGGIVDGTNDLLADGLLNVDVRAALDADLAAPIAGAVAANANVAAPIDASVAANIGSIGSEAIAVADQTAVITQTLEDVTAEATAAQSAEVTQ